MNNLTELTYQEMSDINGGSLTAAAVATGLLGFGVGVAIGLVVVGTVIYFTK